MAESSSINYYPPIPCKHTLEVEDPQHRYGTLLIPYYEEWKDSKSTSTFFAWLDSPDSVGVQDRPSFKARHAAKPRAQIDVARVKYCTPEEATHYRVVYETFGTTSKRLVWTGINPPQNARAGDLVHTNNVHPMGADETKWIFVIDQQGQMFVGEKQKRRFHHSSFVAGASVRCAGRIVVDYGKVRMIMPYSGHYPTSMKILEEVTTAFFERKMPLSDPENIVSDGNLSISPAVFKSNCSSF